MTKKELTIEDLSKEELIEFIKRELFKIDPKRIASVKYDSMTKQAKAWCDQGIKLQGEAMQRSKNINLPTLDRLQAHRDFLDASMICEKGEKLYDEAQKLFEEVWR